MKKILLLAILVQTFNLSFAQFGSGNSKIYNDWKEKTLAVIVYKTAPLYNRVAKNIAEKKWLNNKIEYVDFDELKSLKKRDDIVVLSVKDYSGVSIVLCLSTKMNAAFEWKFYPDKNGSFAIPIQAQYIEDYDDKSWQDDVEMIFDYKLMSTTPVAAGVERLTYSSSERTEMLFELLFSSLEKFKDGEYSFINPKKDNNLYNSEESKNLIREKILYIDKLTIPITNNNKKLIKPDGLNSYYKFNHKVVNEKELGVIIGNNQADALYLHIFYSGSFPVFSIIDIKSKKIIYCGMETANFGDTSSIGSFTRVLENISTFKY